MLRNGILEAAGNTLIDGVEFPLSSDYLEVATEITSTAQKMLFSAWLYSDSSTPLVHNIFAEDPAGAPDFSCSWIGDVFNRIQFTILKGGEGNYSFQCDNGEFERDDNWHHILASAKYDVGSGSRTVHLYVDDIEAATVTSDSGAVGITSFNVKSILKGDPGCAISQFYLTDEYLDLSVVANRRKFITGNYKQANLGSTGSTPTGTQPIIYMKDPAATAGVNSGSGANFTVNGTPVDVVY